MIHQSWNDGKDMEIKANLGLALTVCMGIYSPIIAEDRKGDLWQDDLINISQTSNVVYQKARFLTLDSSQLFNRLKPVANSGVVYKSTRKKGLNKATQIAIDLPLPNGESIHVSVIEDNILPESLKAKYPDIMTYKVLPDNRIVSGRLDSTPNGFHGMLQTREGETIFIDPVAKSLKNLGSDKATYVSYRKSAQKHSKENDIPFSCSVAIAQEVAERSNRSLVSKNQPRSSKSLINYRIAVAATGEYTAKHGGTVASALAAITTTINRVNQVYEQDLGIHLSLVENNDLLIYTNASSDPYDARNGDNRHALLIQNQANIDAIIGADNYDIGHLFSTSGGGLAAVGSVCSNHRKAQGVSGSHYVNDSFALDFVAHEIGHQFGATHSFNGTQGLCAGKTRAARTAFEPGSGSSIMSYAGYCGGDDLQRNSDAMFHIGSIQQIRAYVTDGGGKRCGVQSTASNTAPKVNAGKNYIIPAQTPFELKGNATDVDNDPLVYSWEQVDAGTASPTNHDRGDNALFRVHLPSQSKKRSFPPLSDIISHTTNRGETLPTQQRLMNFRFVVQDSYNITQSDSMAVQVWRTGSRFALNLPRSQYTVGDTYKIRWNVANTDKTPVNCENVDIALSVDDGYQFNHILGKNIPNTGEAWVTIPSEIVATNRGRFKLSCSDNIFFALSYRSFKLNQSDHKSRVILADEDQPERNLADKAVVESEEIVTEAGGGTFDWLLLFLGLIGLSHKRAFRL